MQDIKKIEFPKTLKKIGTESFYFNGLESLELPEGLRELGESAFFKCTKLTEVTLPMSVMRIGKWCFHGCNRLKTLTIRHNPDYIGDWICNKSTVIRCYEGSSVDRYCENLGLTTEYIR